MIGMRKKTMHEQLGELRAKESEQQQKKNAIKRRKYFAKNNKIGKD